MTELRVGDRVIIEAEVIAISDGEPIFKRSLKKDPMIAQRSESFYLLNRDLKEVRKHILAKIKTKFKSLFRFCSRSGFNIHTLCAYCYCSQKLSEKTFSKLLSLIENTKAE